MSLESALSWLVFQARGTTSTGGAQRGLLDSLVLKAMLSRRVRATIGP